MNSWLIELKLKTKTAILKVTKVALCCSPMKREVACVTLMAGDGCWDGCRVGEQHAECCVQPLWFNLWWWECHVWGGKPYQENRFRVATALLAGEGIERMVWPASSPNLNPIPVGPAEAICIFPHQRQQQPWSPVPSSASSVECHPTAAACHQTDQHHDGARRSLAGVAGYRRYWPVYLINLCDFWEEQFLSSIWAHSAKNSWTSFIFTQHF